MAVDVTQRSAASSALPRQRIELLFDEKFYIEASFQCRFDNIEVRDGPFSFSPLMNRFCGPTSPGLVLSSGRFMWIRFFSDDELEGIGFQVRYSFTAGDSKETRDGLLMAMFSPYSPTDRVISHHLPLKDPEFHLHVGGLLNPIPGSVTTQLRLLNMYKSGSICEAKPLFPLSLISFDLLLLIFLLSASVSPTCCCLGARLSV